MPHAPLVGAVTLAARRVLFAHGGGEHVNQSGVHRIAGDYRWGDQQTP